MTPLQSAFLRQLIESGEQVRQKGDAVVANALQSAGLVTVHWLDEGRRIRVLPTPLGRRWLVLVKAREKVPA